MEINKTRFKKEIFVFSLTKATRVLCLVPCDVERKVSSYKFQFKSKERKKSPKRCKCKKNNFVNEDWKERQGWDENQFLFVTILWRFWVRFCLLSLNFLQNKLWKLLWNFNFYDRCNSDATFSRCYTLHCRVLISNELSWNFVSLEINANKNNKQKKVETEEIFTCWSRQSAESTKLKFQHSLWIIFRVVFSSSWTLDDNELFFVKFPENLIWSSQR